MLAILLNNIALFDDRYSGDLFNVRNGEKLYRFNE